MVSSCSNAAIEQNRIWEGELRNLNKQGDYYWVQAIIKPLFNQSGKKIGYRSIRQDITFEKRVEFLNQTLEIASKIFFINFMDRF